MRKTIVLCLLFASVAAALLSHINDRAGRLLLSAGFPGAAAAIMSDPAWKGVAYYSEHRWADAAEAFRQSHSPGSNYNLGNALAQAGQYSAAIDAYVAAVAWEPENVDARTNRHIIEVLMRSDSGKPEVSGQGASAGLIPKEASVDSSAAAAGKNNSGGGVGSLGGGGDAKPSRQMTLYENGALVGPKAKASSTNPDLRWLETLPDKAGTFLKLQIAYEHDRRVETGGVPPGSSQR